MRKNIVPAIWFQNALNPAARRAARKPAVLELLEQQLAQVSGALQSADSTTYDAPGVPGDTTDQ